VEEKHLLNELMPSSQNQASLSIHCLLEVHGSKETINVNGIEKVVQLCFIYIITKASLKYFITKQNLRSQQLALE
jgi:hypothetical protein